MKKYPWIIWLSQLGFILLFAKNSIKILLINRPFDIDQWVRFLGNSLGMLFVAVIIPMVLYLLVVNFMGSSIISTVLLCGFLYFAPVGVNCSICRWIELNSISQRIGGCGGIALVVICRLRVFVFCRMPCEPCFSGMSEIDRPQECFYGPVNLRGGKRCAMLWLKQSN